MPPGPDNSMGIEDGGWLVGIVILAAAVGLPEEKQRNCSPVRSI